MSPYVSQIVESRSIVKGLAARSGAGRPASGEQLAADPVELPDVAPAEAPQERAQGRRAATIEEANEVLAAYLPRHNQRFAVPAAIDEPAWRAWADGLVAASVFAFHYPRKVARDATISWDGAPLALPRQRAGRSWAGRIVTLEERLDSSLWVNHEGHCYPLAPAPPEPRTLRVRDLRRPSPEAPDQPLAHAVPAAPPSGPVKPPSTHPWRRYPALRPR